MGDGETADELRPLIEQVRSDRWGTKNTQALCDAVEALRARADRAEARAAKWKADAERLASDLSHNRRFMEWAIAHPGNSLDLHEALVAEDADEGSGT